MWISSFVVTLPEDSDSACGIRDAIDAIPVFEAGVASNRRLPVVLEAPDGSQARDWHEWVESLPGVISVDVAFVSFEGDHSEPNPQEVV